MRSGQRWTAVATLVVLGSASWLGTRPAAGLEAAACPSPPRVLDVKRISVDRVHGRPPSEPDTQVEPDVAVDRANPDHVVSVFQEGRYPDGAAAAAGFATSRDGGRTWTTGELPGLTRAAGGAFERAGDHVVAFGPDGAAVVATTAFDGQLKPDKRSAIAVIRSADGGSTWGRPSLVVDDHDLNVFNDNPAVAVDTFASSPHRGRIYVAWIRERIHIHRFSSPIVLSRSDDGGATWSGLTPLSFPPDNGQGTQVVVRPDGRVSVLWQRFGFQGGVQEVVRTSNDGGTTFGPPVRISDVRWRESPGMRTGFGIASAAVDPITGRMFVAWQDSRFRTGGLNDAVLVASGDGIHWTVPAPVGRPPGEPLADHLTPDVSAYGGAVAVTFLGRPLLRGRPGNFVDERYAGSTDGGATFGCVASIGPPTDIRFAALAFPGRSRFLGDYMGVSLTAAGAHAVWARAYGVAGGGRDPHQTIWAATIRP